MNALQQLRASREKTSASAWKSYRELLARWNSPRPGDGDALAAAMTALRLNEEVVAEHVGAVEAVAAAAGAQAEIDAADAEHVAIEAKLEKLGLEMQALQAKVGPLRDAQTVAGLKASGARGRIAAADRARAKFPELLAQQVNRA